MNPYFSIILPIYNVAPYLDHCIQSVLTQDFSDYEIILVDDGSTDTSGMLCDDYANRYEHIRVIHKENGGLSSARNAGAEIARGTYIWWVDSDDWIREGALTALYEATRNEKPDVVKFGYTSAEGSVYTPVPMHILPGSYKGRTAVENLVHAAFASASRFVLSAWSHVYRLDFLQKTQIPFVSERIVGSEDYLFNLTILPLANHVRVIPEDLYFYNKREGSLTQRYRENLSKQYVQLFHRLRDAYSGRDEIKKYERDLCAFFIWHLVIGGVIQNAYRVTNGHTLPDGRKEVCRFFRSPELQYAVKICLRGKAAFKKRVQLWAMRNHVEPLFHWIFVVKLKNEGQGL